MASWWVTLLVGLAVLLLGRRLFWLFVGAAGFAVGLHVAPMVLNGPEWLMVVAALVLGILGAVLAIFFQWLAIGLAGFAAGVHGGLAAAAALGFVGAVALGRRLRGGHRGRGARALALGSDPDPAVGPRRRGAAGTAGPGVHGGAAVALHRARRDRHRDPSEPSRAARRRGAVPRPPHLTKETGTMHGVVFLGERALELREFPDPRPGPGEVVLAMKASGMCGSDLHPYRASRSGGAARSLGLGGAGGPCIAGHEPCGVVVERGPGVLEADAPTGARVMNHHYKGCGHCKHCRAGWAQLCPRGIVVYGMTGHGGHAPFMTVPASTLVPLPDELSFEEGAAISCGTGTAYQALRRLDVSGPGHARGLRPGAGRPVGDHARGRHGRARHRRRRRRGAAPARPASSAPTPSSIPGATDVVAALKALTDGEGVDAALDCSGHPDARLAAGARHPHLGTGRLRRGR